MIVAVADIMPPRISAATVSEGRLAYSPGSALGDIYFGIVTGYMGQRAISFC
jgi:hypothetical protein